MHELELVGTSGGNVSVTLVKTCLETSPLWLSARHFLVKQSEVSRLQMIRMQLVFWFQVPERSDGYQNKI